MKNKIYLVVLSEGIYDFYHESIEFATKDKELAESYVKKFNKVKDKLKKFYSEKFFEEEESSEEFDYLWWDKYQSWYSVHDAKIKEVKLR